MKETQFQIIYACKTDDSVVMRSYGFYEDEHCAYSDAESLREGLSVLVDSYDVFVLTHTVDI